MGNICVLREPASPRSSARLLHSPRRTPRSGSAEQNNLLESKAKPLRRRSKGSDISAEVEVPSLPEVARNAQARSRIETRLRKIHVLRRLPLDILRCLVDIAEEEEYHAGQVVCAQGQEADRLFFIEEGKALVQVEEDGECHVVAKLRGQEYFGEVSLSDGSEDSRIRTASVVAASNIRILSFARSALQDRSLRRIILDVLTKNRGHTMVLLKDHPVFGKLKLQDRIRLESAFELRTYSAGNVIVKQGDPAYELFLIQSGAVMVKVADRFGREEHVATLCAGDHFGERALMRNEPRSASVVALDACALLVLTRTQFEELGLREKSKLRTRTPILWAKQLEVQDESDDEEDRLPFSRWMALKSPWIAANPAKMEPFATLEICIRRARDLNSRGAPYVCLELNNQNTFLATKLQRGMSPKWEESFTLDIYHPLSVLSLQVYDGFNGLEGWMKDSLIGYIDLPLRDIPHNMSLHQWMSLRLDARYVNDLRARMSRQTNLADKENSRHGSLHVDIHLKSLRRFDRFFAMCLPEPFFGDGLEDLNMPELLEECLCLNEHIEHTLDYLFGHVWDMLLWRNIMASVLGLLCLQVVVWWPSALIPAVLLLVFFTLMGEHPDACDRCGVVLHLWRLMVLFVYDAALAVAQPIRTFQEFVLIGETPVSVRELRNSSVFTTMTVRRDDVNVVNNLGLSSQKKAAKTAQEVEQQQQVEKNIIEVLRRVQSWIPSSDSENFQRAQLNVRNLLLIFQVIDTVVGWKHRRASAAIALLSLSCSLLLLMSAWVRFFMQLCLSLWLIVILCRYSVLGRLVFAIATGYHQERLGTWETECPGDKMVEQSLSRGKAKRSSEPPCALEKDVGTVRRFSNPPHAVG
eukprot:TRINITY_DN31207_c0_g1_i1.p1 TRINITY_DN31207_c0_g1~~TRINITY_DN31207_c0_g1_i1.p1  ORF type:complete len:865 (-),score=95.07 TRINITY_DN31207_c0_g1_i1:199-2793(-)